MSGTLTFIQSANGCWIYFVKQHAPGGVAQCIYAAYMDLSFEIRSYQCTCF